MSTERHVDFVIAGAQKCGTRALQGFLAQHPAIGFRTPPLVESHFFDRNASANRSSYEEYHEQYTPDALAKVTGDVTPNYLYWTGSFERMRKYNPHMSIIVLLRDPVDRAYSQWVMQQETGRERSGFAMALAKEGPMRLIRGQHMNSSYLQRGFYHRQLTRLYESFPPAQCLILRTEDLRDEHEATMRRVFEFLGVDTKHVPPPDTVHSRPHHPVPALMRRLLVPIFRSDIRRTERLLGWDCAEWRSTAS